MTPGEFESWLTKKSTITLSDLIRPGNLRGKNCRTRDTI
jgi:hypothetical protein